MISQEPTITRQQIPAHPPTRRRGLVAGAVIVAMALGGLGGWFLKDRMQGSEIPSDVETVIADYLDAWEAKDEAAVRAATTEDFIIAERIYNPTAERQGAIGLEERIDDDIDGVVLRGFLFDWNNEYRGEPLVVGDGPWFVSYDESWFLDRSIDIVHYDGVATYVVVEEDGVMKIASHYWAGLRSWETLD
jgi:hypothetical protein